ncbi:DUF4878 domain-containing protein [Tyzzerella sp. An114]|uniref:DUF4878 domain-containing protein n=1 Tax=Tyzzerella sp. An114 TaxID=1965545 RepID=UPI00130290EB|nr:DUF4878 domain-containing protein [Tyzzerella sp. An114]
MKKLLALLIAVIMCFGLSSCSKTESPEKAAENVLIAFQKGDFETIEKYMTGTFSSEGEESSSEDEEMIKNITKNLTFEIKSSEEKDGKATVNVDITNVDMSVVMQNVFSTMFTELLSSAFNEDGTEKTQEEINTRTIEIMNEEISKAEKKTTNININFTLKDNQWVIENTEEFGDAVTGGMITYMSGVAESFNSLSE